MAGLVLCVALTPACGGPSGLGGQTSSVEAGGGDGPRSGGMITAMSAAGVADTVGVPGTENAEGAAIRSNATVRFESRETWYVVRIAGRAVGFSSEAIDVRTGEVRYRSHTDLSMTRMGTPLKMFMLIEEVSAPDGTFRSAHMKLDASVMGMNITCHRTPDDSVVVRTRTGGHVRTERMAWEKGAITQVVVEKRVNRWLMTGADTLNFTVFDSNGGEFKHMHLVRGQWNNETADSSTGALLPVREYEGDGPATISTSWYNKKYEPVRTVVRQMGLEITIDRITRAQMASIHITPNFDIIRQSMISCPGFPKLTATLQDVTLRLDLPSGVPAAARLNGPNQRVLARGKNWVEVELTRAMANRMALDPSKRAGYLEPDAFIQSDAPAIIAVADSIRRATGTSGWELARELARWVNQRIVHKNYSQGFASALEAMSSQSGDCTEHSVLLTALLRAAKIPARPTVGLVYFKGAFAGHMWTEVYVDHWRTLDALDLSTAPIRLRVTASKSHEAVDERDLVQAYSFVGGMRATVVASHVH